MNCGLLARRPLLQARSRTASYWSHLEVLSQLVRELGLGRQLLVSAGVNLSSSTAGSAQNGAYCSAFPAAQQCAQYGANGGAAANVFSGTRVRTQSARSTT